MEIYNFVRFLLLILYFTKTSNAECRQDSTKSAHTKLKEYLLCDYEKSIRPIINHQNSTIITIRMILKSFTYSVSATYLAVNSWLALSWKDDHLKWDPAKYESITTTHLSSEEIWTPDLSLYNRDNQGDDPSALSTTNCLIRHNGIVACVPATRNDALCIPDLTKFPFDTQKCSLTFGSWVHNGEEINFTMAKPAISLEDYSPNSDWKLLNITAVRNPGTYGTLNHTYPSLTYIFLIERHASTHISTIIMPSIVMVFLTLLTLLLQPTSTERICLASINLVCHFLYLQHVSWEVPPNGDKSPLILTFLKDSMLLSAFSVLITVIIREILSRKDDSPRWVTSLTVYVINSNIRPFLLLSQVDEKASIATGDDDDGTNLVNIQAARHRDWLILSKIIDRISFIMFLFTYIILFIIILCS